MDRPMSEEECQEHIRGLERQRRVFQKQADMLDAAKAANPFGRLETAVVTSMVWIFVGLILYAEGGFCGT